MNILCVTRFYKGTDFIRQCAELGHKVYFLTSSKHKEKPWPYECITESFYMDEDAGGEWNMLHVINGLAWKLRGVQMDVFVSLDDFDVENTAMMREHFRIPGMGQTTSRYFRDKLAMRFKAAEHKINVPDFSPLFSDDQINQFADSVPAPWLVKPRTQASAAGIKKVHSKDELWQHLDSLGDQRHNFLVERFAPGDVFHVDSLIYNGKVIFAKASRYLDTPFEVAHGGGVFRSVTLESGSKEEKDLLKVNESIMQAFGMRYSASHTEFIRNRADGKIYFLETSCRVGGANIAEMVDAATGINLWREWARIEVASREKSVYELPKTRKYHAGIIVSLSKHKHPDDSVFADPEICWRMKKDHHVGLIMKSESHDRILELLDKYAHIIRDQFHAAMPARDRPVA